MKKFFLGFIAGAATYHVVGGGFKNDELITEVRGAIQRLDERLAQQDTSEAEPVSAPTIVPDPGEEG